MKSGASFLLTVAVDAANVRAPMNMLNTNYGLKRAVAIYVTMRNRVASWLAATEQEGFI